MSAAVTVKLPKALDARYARELQHQLKTMTRVESPRVVLDFSRVKEIDLSGLEGLLSCMDQLARQDGGLRLASLSAEAATILEMTRMNHLMEKFGGVPPVDAPEFELTPESSVEEVPSENPVQLPVAA